jgi:hypothetical protein
MKKNKYFQLPNLSFRTKVFVSMKLRLGGLFGNVTAKKHFHNIDTCFVFSQIRQPNILIQL